MRLIPGHYWKAFRNTFPVVGFDVQIEIMGVTLFEFIMIYQEITLIVMNFTLTLSWR